jgi:two-component system LytT family response regulator
MLTCYIIDDEAHAIEALTRYIEKMPELLLIGSHTNPILALAEIKDNVPDLVFLDVEMPELSGIELAELLPAGVTVIFTTAHARYALNAYEKDVVAFLLKPFSFAMFLKAVTKASTGLQKTKEQISTQASTHIFIKKDNKNVIQLNLSDIISVDAIDHYICIHLNKNDKHVTHISMKEVLQKLPDVNFIRIHKTHIINIDHIQSIEGNQVVMSNHKKIQLGETYKSAFLEKIQSRMLKRFRLG